jgi:choline-glycine betaine transporter
MDQNTPQGEYKPNIYPIMYWAILYGIVAAFVLLVISMLANYITVLWFPVFLAGVVWGGYRKYKQDKAAWAQSQGTPNAPKTPVEEFKDAARDIAQASREMIARQAQEDAQAVQTVQEEIAQEEATVAAAETPAEETIPEATPEEEIVTQQPEEPRTPQSPLQPLV